MSVTGRKIGQHDLGSGPLEEAFGPLPDRGDRQFAYWERQIHACLGILTKKGLMTLDEMRRCVEGLEPEMYKKAAYYEKWAAAIATVLLERGSITNAELDDKLGPACEPDVSEPFPVGSVVRVRRSSHYTRWRRPHLRTPGFVHGVCGVVERYVGTFSNPEKLAFGGSTTNKQPMYIVRFDWRSIYDVMENDAAVAAAEDTDGVTCDIYHCWLEPATEEDLARQREISKCSGRTDERERQPDYKKLRVSSFGESHEHTHEHSHSHDDGHGDAHEQRLTVEQRAVDSEIPCPAIAKALVEVLLSKGHITAEQLRAAIETIDSWNIDRGAVGRRVVVKAWLDVGFKSRLLADANSACAELGISASNPVAPTQLMVFEQTVAEHHLIVCTLCSCYPMALLGLPPDWYKSREYRARAVREPRAVLREFGTEIPKGTRLIVHDSTADCRFMVIPKRPEGTELWSAEQLETIVTRDSMLGVTALARSRL